MRMVKDAGGKRGQEKHEVLKSHQNRVNRRMTPSSNLESPCHIARICAAANGFLGTMDELLLDKRVDLEVATRLGQTALFKAAPGWQKRSERGARCVL